MVQVIAEIIQNQGRETRQTSLPALQQKTMLISKYGNREVFLIAFNPDMQRQICTDSELCMFGDYPTLSTLREGYGNNAPTMWLIPQLTNLSEYCGCKEKLQGKPLEECASIIANEFHYLKVSEMMLFFYRFKAGQYGRFYGSVDPLVITTSLREFLKERAYAYDRHEREERERQREEEMKNAVSWKEYCKMQEEALRSEGKNEEADAWKGRKNPMLSDYSSRKGKKEAKDDEKTIIKIIKSCLNNPEASEESKKAFRQSFKKKYGYTPQEYIEKNSDNGKN